VGEGVIRPVPFAGNCGDATSRAALLINESARQGPARNERARFLRGYPITLRLLCLSSSFSFMYRSAINLSKLVTIARSLITSGIEHTSLIVPN